MGIENKDKANFSPSVEIPAKVDSFRFWCQKVLPLVYDDSLSYYELLCKVVNYLNNTIADVNTLGTDVDNINKAYNELQNYVNEYFSTLNVQEEINNKLDVMASNGTLSNLIKPLFNEYKTEINNEVNSQNDKITVLENRMNAFTSLPSGSTSGDAELIDIRVPASGFNNNKNYASAGDAVRGQVSYLKKNLDNIYYSNNLFTNAKFIPNKYYNNNNDTATYETLGYFECTLEAGTYHVYPRCKFIRQGDNTAIGTDNINEPQTFNIAHNSIIRITIYMTDLKYVKLYKDEIEITNVCDYGVISLQNNISFTPEKNSKIIRNDIFVKNKNYFKNGKLIKNKFYIGNNSTTGQAKGEYNSTVYSYFKNIVLPPGTYTIYPKCRFLVINDYAKLEQDTGKPYTFTINNYSDVAISVYNNDVWKMKLFSSDEDYHFIPDYNADYLKPSIYNYSNILSGKKVVFCGDSFTEYTAVKGGSTEKTQDNYDFDLKCYKTYPWWITKRNNCILINEAKSGSTMTNTGNRSDAFSVTRYKQIPKDADYIIIKFGINDGNEGATIGSINDSTNNTFYGAWNVVMQYLRTNYPMAKIGIIITNGLDSNVDYAIAEIDIAKKYGVSFLNEALGTDIPVFYRTSRKDIAPSVIKMLIDNFQINAEKNDFHPTVQWHEYESTIVENWMRSL